MEYGLSFILVNSIWHALPSIVLFSPFPVTIEIDLGQGDHCWSCLVWRAVQQAWHGFWMLLNEWNILSFWQQISWVQMDAWPSWRDVFASFAPCTIEKWTSSGPLWVPVKMHPCSSPACMPSHHRGGIGSPNKGWYDYIFVPGSIPQWQDSKGCHSTRQSSTQWFAPDCWLVGNFGLWFVYWNMVYICFHIS